MSEGTLKIGKKPIKKIILKGEAPKSINPINQEINGNIKAVSDFVLHKTFDNVYSCDNSLIVVDRSKGTITFDSNVTKDDHRVKIVSKLTFLHEINALRINSYQYMTLTELLNMIRPARRLFQDRDRHATVMDSLSNFKVKYERELQASNDSKGNVTQNFTQTMKDAKDLNFVINFPIFPNQESVKFEVDVLVEIRDKAVLFTLESIELMEISQDLSDKIIDAELDQLRGLIKVIEK